MTPTSENELASRRCRACNKETEPLNEKQIQEFLNQVEGWRFEPGAGIYREFSFKDYDETTGFVQAVTRLAKEEDHHPDVFFGYKKCRVTYMTHAIKGLSENDFISAAKVNALKRNGS